MGEADVTPSHRYNYVVTAHKPTAVTQCAVGNFTSPSEMNLIIGKSTRLEIHTLTPSGLEAKLDVPIYGRISALKLFKPSTKSKSMLFLLTERYKFCVLEYSAEGKLLTVANGVVEDAIGRPAECGHICVVDEDATMIGLHMYDGHLKIIPIDDQGGLSEQAFNVRLDELKLVDMAFIGKGVLGVLHEDTKGSRHVRSYKIGKGGVLEDGGMRVANVDGGMIVPGPAGDGGFGCLVVGKQVVTKLTEPSDPSSQSSYGYTDGRAVMMRAWARVNDSTVLFGDSIGDLYVCEHRDGVRLQRIGGTSVASALAYLDSGVVFVGSALGDSQLVKISADDGLEILDEMANLGPIVDFIVGERGLVVCGGGGLRSVRSGVGVTELGVAGLEGLRRVWGIGDKVVVGLRGGENVVLGMVDGEVGEVESDFIKLGEKTIECFELDGRVVQVTNKDIFCNGKLLWSCTEGQILHAAKSTGGKSIVIADSSKMVTVVDHNSGKILVTFATQAESTCVAVYESIDSRGSMVVCCGLWDASLLVWKNGEVTTLYLGEDELARSIVLKYSDDELIAIVGEGSGIARTFCVSDNGLQNRQRVPIGYEPVVLRDLGSKVVALSDRMAIFAGAIWSAANMTSKVWDATLWQEYVVLAMEDEIKFCSLSEKQGIAVEKSDFAIDAAEAMPRRIATLGMDSGRSTSNSSILVAASKAGMESIVLLTLGLEKVCDHELGENEVITSVCSAGNSYFVGTALNGGAAEPSGGKIRRFEVNNKLELVAIVPTNGAVYSLTTTKTGLLVAGVGSSVVVYEDSVVEGKTTSLDLVTQLGGFSVVLDVSVVETASGTFKLAVADLMRSVSLLSFDPESQTLSMIARELSPRWLSAALLVDPTRVVLGDSNFNLGVLEHNTNVNDEDIIRLTNIGEQYCGNFINRFRVGRLSPLAGMDVVIFGTISGSIGLIAPLSKEEFTILRHLQSSLENVVGCIGGFDVKQYRLPNSTIVRADTSDTVGSLIDGDIVESILELSPVEQQEALAGLSASEAEQAIALVERLSRLK